MKVTVDGITYEGTEDEIRRIVENPPRRPPIQTPDDRITITYQQPRIDYRWALSGKPPEPIPSSIVSMNEWLDKVSKPRPGWQADSTTSGTDLHGKEAE